MFFKHRTETTLKLVAVDGTHDHDNSFWIELPFNWWLNLWLNIAFQIEKKKNKQIHSIEISVSIETALFIMLHNIWHYVTKIRC